MLRPDTFALTMLLAMLTAIGPLSVDMYLPSLPEMGRLLNASPGAVQLTISVYLVGFAIGQVLYGPASDRFGRKQVLLVALTLFCAASVICVVAPSIEMLIVARGLQALGGAGASVLARAIVRDLYSGARAGRELSLMSAIMALAPIAAPVVGAGLQSAFGWRSNFVVIVVVGVAALVAVWRFLPETLSVRRPEPLSFLSVLRAYRLIAANRLFLAYFTMAAAAYAGLFAWISGTPFVLQDHYALSPLAFGLAFAVSAAGYMAGTLLAARLVVRLGLDRTIGLGALALCGSGLGIVLTVALGIDTAEWIVAFGALYLAGLGLAMPQAIAGALSPFPDRAGTASSLVGFLQQTAAAIVGAIVGQMIGHSAWPLAIALILTGGVTAALWILSRRVRAIG
jgi:DHA1 family bicyclomycin/chloramphenicol resistance-like MFS transporter